MDLNKRMLAGFMSRDYKEIIYSSIMVLVFAMFTGASVQAQNERLQDVMVGPGDAIHLSIFEGGFAPNSDQFIFNFHNKIFIVNGFGEIDLYTLGKVKIADLTTSQIVTLLNEKLMPYAREPMIIVRPLVRVTMRGDFGQPGMYRFGLDTSLWDMVRQAGGLVGGLDGLSALESMFIMRKDEIIYRDFVEAVHNGTSIFDLGIESGDEIIVPRANRPTFQSMIRYFQFGMSLIILYLTLLNKA